MGQRRKFSAEYKREAVAMLDARCQRRPDRHGPRDWGDRAGALATGVASGVGAGVSGAWPTAGREPGPYAAGVSPRDEGAGFFVRSGRVLRESVAMKYRMIQRCREAFPIPTDVPVFAGLPQRVTMTIQQSGIEVSVLAVKRRH